MQNHLPQDQSQRLTVGVARLHNTTGYSLNYAYMMDNERNSALTLSVGQAGDETAVRGSFGFEFGGKRSMKMDLSGVNAYAVTEPAEPEVVYATPPGQVALSETEYEALLMAQVQEEELEQLEDRYAQQQSLIEELQKEMDSHDVDEAELERLKRQAAQLAAEQEARKQSEADYRARAKARLTARESQGNEKESSDE
jgi:hypothetical protein